MLGAHNRFESKHQAVLINSEKGVAYATVYANTSMKLVYEETLMDAGTFSTSDEWAAIISQVRAAVTSVVWPPGSQTFSINPVKKRNGVKPIKDRCMDLLCSRFGWTLEVLMDLGGPRLPGKVDAMRPTSTRPLVLEWETGNISSSHRALNKIALGLLGNVIIGGILVLPTRSFYKYLTDRVGNYEELSPYFPIWRNLPITDGILVVMGIEHDATDANVPIIPKGTDGRALG